MGSALGDYIHYSAKNYNKYGIGYYSKGTLTNKNTIDYTKFIEDLQKRSVQKKKLNLKKIEKDYNIRKKDIVNKLLQLKGTNSQQYYSIMAQILGNANKYLKAAFEKFGVDSATVRNFIDAFSINSKTGNLNLTSSSAAKAEGYRSLPTFVKGVQFTYSHTILGWIENIVKPNVKTRIGDAGGELMKNIHIFKKLIIW